MLTRLKENKVLLAFLLLALAARIHFECTYVDLNMDKARQFFMAQNFIEGNGFSFCTADFSDLSRTVCQRIPYWPIGYPLIIAGLNGLLNDYVLSSIVLDVLGVLILLYAFHTLIGVLGLGRRAYILFMVFTAFAFTPYFYAGSTDFLSAALYLFALAMTLSHLGREGVYPLRFILIGLAVFAAALFRYAYYPFLLVIPFFLLVHAVHQKNRSSLYRSLITLAASLLPLIGLLIYYKSHFGSPFFVKSTDNFFFGHLLHMDPFPLKSIFYLEVIEKNVVQVLPALESLIRPATWVLSILVLAMMLFHFLSSCIRGRSRESNGILRSFYALLFLTVSLNVALLSWYSLKNPPQSFWIDWWTYVQETRYYAPSMLLIQVALFVVLFKNGGNRILEYTTGTILVAAVAFSVIFGANRMVQVHVGREPTFLDERKQEISEVTKAIGDLRKRGIENIVYADGISVSGISIHDACLVAVTTPARIVLNYHGLISRPLKTSVPLALLMKMPKNKTPEEKRLIQQHAPTCLDEGEGYSLYLFELP
ncbi:MAG: hypothetical protein ACYTG7_00685 [Planctomycetota bacterium]|jgi:hypothetical protein